jgi:hypothetical protein
MRDYGGQVAHGVKSFGRRKEVGSLRFEVKGSRQKEQGERFKGKKK